MPSRPGSCTWSACFRSSPKNKKPGSFDPGLFCCFVWLDGADAAGARALGARFDLEGHLLATAEAVEVAFGATPVEEEFLTVLGCNKAEATVRDQLLDGACRHFHLLYLSNSRPTQLGGPVRETEPAVSAGTLPATESIPVSAWTYSWGLFSAGWRSIQSGGEHATGRPRSDSACAAGDAVELPPGARPQQGSRATARGSACWPESTAPRCRRSTT